MKRLMFVLLAAVLLCGCSAKRSEKQVEEAYSSGYTDGYNAARNDTDVVLSDVVMARFSGRFTATVEKLIPDYCALPGNTIAVVHFFQDMPFLLRFEDDMTGKLVEGETYIFDFAPFSVQVADAESEPRIEDYMYQIKVVNYRLAEADETGMESILPDVEYIVVD